MPNLVSKYSIIPDFCASPECFFRGGSKLKCSVDKGKEALNTTVSGSASAQHRMLAFGSFVNFQGIRTTIA